MTKEELVTALAVDNNITKTASRRAIEGLVRIISAKLAEGEEIRLENFGVFKVKRRKAKKARNLHTNEEVIVPERNVVVFKPWRLLDEMINEKKEVKMK